MQTGTEQKLKCYRVVLQNIQLTISQPQNENIRFNRYPSTYTCSSRHFSYSYHFIDWRWKMWKENSLKVAEDVYYTKRFMDSKSSLPTAQFSIIFQFI